MLEISSQSEWLSGDNEDIGWRRIWKQSSFRSQWPGFVVAGGAAKSESKHRKVVSSLQSHRYKRDSREIVEATSETSHKALELFDHSPELPETRTMQDIIIESSSGVRVIQAASHRSGTQLRDG